MFQNLGIHRACAIPPICIQSLPACHRSDLCHCKQHWHLQINTTAWELAPPRCSINPHNVPIWYKWHSSSFPLLWSLRISPSFFGFSFVHTGWFVTKLAQLACASHFPHTGPITLFLIFLDLSTCVWLWYVPCFPTSPSQKHIMTCGFVGPSILKTSPFLL